MLGRSMLAARNFVWRPSMQPPRLAGVLLPVAIMIVTGAGATFADAAPAAAAATAAALRSPKDFASIADRAERSRALFVEAGKVIASPRCQNCHPVGDRPSQG